MQNKCQVSKFETCSYLRYKGIYATRKVSGRSRNGPLGPVSRKSRKLFGPEKPFVKLRPVYPVTLVFSYVVKGIKIKVTVKFRASRRLRFEDTKKIMSPEMGPKSFGTFEKQAPGWESNPEVVESNPEVAVAIPTS